MNLTDTKTLLTEMITNKCLVTPYLWGAHGLGKSSIVREVAKDLGYNCITLILSQREAIDLQGMLYTYKDEISGISATSSHPPEWFLNAMNNGKTILFLDEFNQARKEVLNASFQLVLDRELNGRKLPDDVFILCASNPCDDRYDVTELSESLVDRFLHLQVTPDVKGWLNYAKGNPNFDPKVVKFLEASPNALRHEDDRDNTFPVKIKHSERSWERLSRINKLNLPVNIKLECFRGIVGTDLALLFMQLRK